MLQLGKSEFFGQQFKADVVSYQFMTKNIQRTFDDFVVVESQVRDVVNVYPLGFSREAGGFWGVIIQLHKRVISNGDYAALGMGAKKAKPFLVLQVLHTLGVAKGEELLEVNAL